MKIEEYLNEVKQRLNISSDYELAKRLEIYGSGLSEMRKGNRTVPLDVAYKIAIALDLDPAYVVADLHAQREKNAKRKGFWRDFLSRAVNLAVLLACTLAFNCGAGCVSGPGSAVLFRRPRSA